MEEIFSVQTDGMGNVILVIGGQECAREKVENDTDSAFLEAVSRLIGEQGENLHTYLY